jgi:transcriptional regulator with XRE-family HTH domain
VNELEDWLNRPSRLADELKKLRRSAKLTGTQLANELGWAQSKVSRLERGIRIPSEIDILAWVRGVGGDDDLAQELIGMLGEVRAQHNLWRRQLRESQVDHQLDFDELGKSAAVVRNIETAMIPGLLQTAEYARWKFRENIIAYGLEVQDVDGAVAARMQRQAILYDATKEFHFLITETPMQMFPCPPSVMVGQLDRILAILGMPNIDFGIIPCGQRRVLAQHGFALFDSVAIVETHTSEIVLRGDESEGYERMYGLLREEAAIGEEARLLVVQALERLRHLSAKGEPQ